MSIQNLGPLTMLFSKVALVLLLAEAFVCDASIVELSAHSEVIVKGSITMRMESDTNVSFDLNIDKVLKGDPTTQTVHVSHDWQRDGLSANDSPRLIRARYYGIWFLVHKTSAEWDVLPVTRDGFIFTLFSPASTTNAKSSTEPTEALVYELVAGFEEMPRTAEEMLMPASLPGATADIVLNRFVNSSNLSLRTSGVAGMLTRSEEVALGQFVRLWPEVKDTPGQDLVISELRNSFRNGEPKSIAQLIAIADTQGSPADLRAVVLKAISAIHTRESLPFLAGLLSSDDSHERMFAVIGLSSFANGCPMQTPNNVASMEYMQFMNASIYRTPETINAFAFGPVSSEQQARLVEFWAEWWNWHKAEFQNEISRR